MKKILCVFFTLLMLLIPFSCLTVHAASGNLSASASANTVTIGSNVTVTLKYNSDIGIAAIDATVKYNAAAFQFVSATGAEAFGNAGLVRASYYASSLNKTQTITLTFKAIAVGAGNFAITTGNFNGELTSSDAGYVAENPNDPKNYPSLGNPSQTLAVSAINPTKSANAYLASIKPSSGTLTPAFKPDVTSYTISVPYSVSSLSLSVTTQDKDAKTAVAGKNTLAVGKNTQEITVTAPNGTTKKYTVVITRAAKPTTTGSSTTASTTTKPTKPTSIEENPLAVEADGVTMTIVDTQPSVNLPQGFVWGVETFKDIAVSAAKNEVLGITLVYLTNPQDNTASFYIYDKEKAVFERFRQITVKGGQYILFDMPQGMTAPAGTALDNKTIGEKPLTVFAFEDTAFADVALVYATSPAGKTGLYMYDATDGSMQLYREIFLPVIAPTAPTTTQEKDDTSGAFGLFVLENRTVILICAAACGGLALLIGAIIMLSISLRRAKTSCKH